MISDEEIIDRFKHHPPSTPEIVDAHNKVRAWFTDLALSLNDVLPEGREKSMAYTKLEEAMFCANAAIARQQRVGP